LPFLLLWLLGCHGPEGLAMTLEDKGYFASFVPCDDEVSRLFEEAQLTKQSNTFASTRRKKPVFASTCAKQSNNYYLQ
jgi:hypothetical protein